jgi:hypothetical protein
MYSIGKGNYGTTGFSASVLAGMKEKANVKGSGMTLDEFEENIGLSFIESLTLTSKPFYNPHDWDYVESEESTDHDD